MARKQKDENGAGRDSRKPPGRAPGDQPAARPATPLWPDLPLDRWRELERAARNREGALLARHSELHWSNQARRGCALAVYCGKEVVLRSRSRPGDAVHGKRGITTYVGAEINSGTWLGVEGTGGTFTTVIINIRMEVNIDRAGRRYREENDVVRRERANAVPPRRVGFDDLPVEFMSLHEEIHAAEICAALVPIARRMIRCTMTPAQQRALQRALQAEYDAMTALAEHGDPPADPGGVQGAVEERVRRAAWAEWDRRHP